MNWYDDYPHIGYDLDGTKIMKPAKGDEVNYMPYRQLWGRNVKREETGDRVTGCT